LPEPVIAGGGQTLPLDENQIQKLLDQGVDRRGLEELVNIGQELSRRKTQENIRYYQPFAHQLAAHRSPAKIRLCLGGNRSGKTTFDVAETCWYATQTHPYRKTPKPPVRMRICCTDFNSGIEKVMIPKFQEFVMREDLKGGSWETAYSKEKRTLYWNNDSFAEFMSYDQDVEKFGGTSRHLIIEDEPAPVDIHNENMSRLLDTKGSLIMSLTPINLDARTGWIYDFWKSASEAKDPSVAWFFFDIYGNTSFTKEEIDKFAASLPESERIARIQGKFPQLLGIIYKQFSRGKHVIPQRAPDSDWTIEIWSDPHTRKATAAVFVGIDRDDNVYVWDEMQQTGTGKFIVDKMKLILGNRRLNRGIMDNAAKDKNEVLGGRSVWDEFLDPDGDGSDKGLYFITVSNKEKEVLPGIRQVEDYLGLDAVYQKPKLFVMDNCLQTIAQFESYIWDDYKRKLEMGLKEKPKKTNDDLMDCIRYGIRANPRHVTPGLVYIEEPVYDEHTGYVIG
jgi:phage terminase large subunit-like protein